MQINIYTDPINPSYPYHDNRIYTITHCTAGVIHLRPGTIWLKRGNADPHIHNMVNPFPPNMIYTHIVI
ncbi:hypothetical protein FKM82_023025 [Ascaphus truei]